jgi:cell division protein FtsN
MASKKRRRNEQAPGWAWMLFGLSIGLTVALVVYLKSGGPGLPAPRPAAVTAPVERSTPDAEAAPPPVARIAAPPADETADETDLEFYEKLRAVEIVVPDAPNRTPQEYTIQAGSFRTHEEADRRQATLALLAIESHIDRVIIDNAIWYRVIIGPLNERTEISRILRELRDERIESMPPRAVSK